MHMHFDPSPKAKGHQLCPMLCLWSGQHRTAMLFLVKARLEAIPSLWHWWMTGLRSPRLAECVWREPGTEIKRVTEVLCDSYILILCLYFFLFSSSFCFTFSPISLPALCLYFDFWQVLFRSQGVLQFQPRQSHWVHVCLSGDQHFLYITLWGIWLSWTHIYTLNIYTHTHIYIALPQFVCDYQPVALLCKSSFSGRFMTVLMDKLLCSRATGSVCVCFRTCILCVCSNGD